jgi:hypothetical protein
MKEFSDATKKLSEPARDAKRKVQVVDLGKAGSFKVHKGAFTKKANAAGKSVHAMAEAHKHDKGKTGAQARSALGFEAMHH